MRVGIVFILIGIFTSGCNQELTGSSGAPLAFKTTEVGKVAMGEYWSQTIEVESSSSAAVRLQAYADPACSTPANGILSVQQNPVVPVEGLAVFKNIRYWNEGSLAQDIYLGATLDGAGLTQCLKQPVSVILPIADYGGRALLETSAENAAAAPKSVAQGPDVVAEAPVGYITDRHPVFKWQGLTRSSGFNFRLKETRSGAVVFEKLGATESSLVLPSSITLKTGVKYTWTVEPGSGSAEFLIFDPALAPSPSWPLNYIYTDTPEFRWSHVGAAVKYEVELIERDSRNLVYTGLSTSNSFLLPPSVTLKQSVIYLWRVRAIGGSGLASAWSHMLGFVSYDPEFIPKPGLPVGYITDLDPSFSWRAVAGAAYYEFELFDYLNSAFVLRSTGLTSGALDLPSGQVLHLDRVYHWRVRAVGFDGLPSRWSEWRPFVIYDAALVPQPRYPSAYLTALSPQFKWSSVAGSNLYEVELVENKTRRLVLRKTVLNETSLSLPPELLLDRSIVYVWRVRSLATGNPGYWSAWKSFLIYDPRFAPQPQSPAGTVMGLRPEFSWSQVADAMAYEIEVWEQSRLIYQGASRTAALTLVEGFKFKPGTTYVWRARTVNLRYQVSDWSEPLRFSVK